MKILCVGGPANGRSHDGGDYETLHVPVDRPTPVAAMVPFEVPSVERFVYRRATVHTDGLRRLYWIPATVPEGEEINFLFGIFEAMAVLRGPL